MPLEITNLPGLLPITVPSNLAALVSPAENIVHGYNIAEQTCFHKTTVSNVIPAFSRLSAFVKGIDRLLQPVRALISAASTLITDVATAVPLISTMLGAVTTVVGALTRVVGTLTTLVTTAVGLVTTIIGSLGGIATACLVAAIATMAVGVVFGFGFVGAAGIALTVLLAIVFFAVRGAVMTIATALGTLNTALGALTAPLATLTGALGPLNTAIGAVNSILSNPALPSDVTRSLAAASMALTDLQNALTAGSPFTGTLSSTATTLDDRVSALRSFLAPTPTTVPPTPKVPRAHLEDTYQDAVAIYNAGTAATQATGPVWDAMRLDANNAPQIEPNGNLDKALKCAGQFQEG